MRYELTDHEWVAIKPFLPNKPRGVPRVNDRRVLNGIFWVLRSGAPWRDLPDNFGPYTTCYNRFARWRKAGVWDAVMNALAAEHDAAVQTIDSGAAHETDDAREVARPFPALDELRVDFGGVGAERRLGAGRLRRVLRELEILEHHRGRKSRLVVAVGRRSRHRPRHRAIARHRPALP